jgi:hypothetical protein
MRAKWHLPLISQEIEGKITQIREAECGACTFVWEMGKDESWKTNYLYV